ncbi:hypothetical protein AAIB46_35230 [Streptomyces sp. 35M1]
MGGVGALRGALAHRTGLLEAGERKVEEAVRPAFLGEPIPEIG